MFASVLDPDFPGHVILEQFQAQVRNAATRFESYVVDNRCWKCFLFYTFTHISVYCYVIYVLHLSALCICSHVLHYHYVYL